MRNSRRNIQSLFLAGEYDKQLFYDAVKGMEREKEGGRRCFCCYELRLLEAAREAKKGNFDYFTTTLSISPMKNAAKLNEIGERIGEEIGVPYLLSDFKRRMDTVARWNYRDCMDFTGRITVAVSSQNKSEKLRRKKC